jgi:S1-C subfamily serine protease
MSSSLAALSNDLARAVERAARSVVSIEARRDAFGSGIFWRSGVIVMAAHSLKEEAEVRIVLPSGEKVRAAITGRDPGTDIAVAETQSAGEPLTSAGAESLRPGEVVLAVGRSAEAGAHATMGVISAVAGPWRTWRGGLIDRFVRLDVAAYPGSSGSALVDSQGRLLGMVTSGLSRAAPLAIPISTVERVAAELLARGHITRGYLGVGLQAVPLPPDLASKNSLSAEPGLILLSVEPDGPAAKGGLLLGDILVGLGGSRVRDTDDVQALLESESVGKELAATVIRGGQLSQLKVTVGERPATR